jgi:KUP system potassium uptake protein
MTIVQVQSPNHTGRSQVMSSGHTLQTTGDEITFLNACRDAGVVHILGNTIIRAQRDSWIVKKIAINYLYALLRKICRENSAIFHVPHESLLNVGQVFYV